MPAPTDQATAEIVTFQTLPQHSPEDVAIAARALDPILARTPGFRQRHLSRRDDGLWTDHVVWADLESALAAAETVMSEPAAAAFLAMIDMPSVRMSHGPILLARSVPVQP